MTFTKELFARALRGRLSQLDALYQRHAGEECYLFGDGGSLRWMDLTRLADRPSITGNMVIYHREAGALRMPYCTITEPYFFYPFFPYRGTGRLKMLRHHMHEEYMRTMPQYPDTTFFVNYSNYPTTRRMRNVLYVTRWYAPPFTEKNPFRERADSHHGTLRFQLSLAIFLGFSRAYLIGHDYTHDRTHERHFYERWDEQLTEHPGYMSDFLPYAQRHIDIRTVTLSGGSVSLPAVTYEELTGAAPRFRPNVEIIDRARLESLSTWFGYEIF